MPNTGNIGLEVPTTGSEAGTWGSASINPDMVAIDGLIGGSVTVGLTNANVTLTAPAGKAIAAAAGPVQSQNKAVVFTGTLTGNVTITLPLPGHYVIDNQTLGAFVITVRGVTATRVIGLPPGFCGTIFNDGANVKFCDLGKTGSKEHWMGIIAMPAWVAACTVKPYLLLDGTATYLLSDYPALGAMFGSTFGGDGVTTFGVPDTRGRVSLPYDGTGTRITSAGCGINGQSLNASGGTQNVTLIRSDLPNDNVSVTITDPGHAHTFNSVISNFSNGGNGFNRPLSSDPAFSGLVNSATTGITAAFYLNGNVTQTTVRNVQPSIVTGIDVVKT
jgi:microcystin-dependent protein